MHNDPNENLLDAQTERELRNMAKRALGKKQRLSYFERRDVIDLQCDKAMDSHGNLDLNEMANQTHQSGGSSRINPNVRTSGSYTGSEATPAAKAMNAKAKCHQHCAKNTGRSQCPHCFGQGYETGDRMQTTSNHSRDLIGD